MRLPIMGRIARRPRDLPLRDDGSARFLPWLIALMVYLAALSIAAVFALNGLLGRWDDGLAGTMTVQLPRPATGQAVSADQLSQVLKVLRGTPGILSAEALDAGAEAALLAPWLGTSVDLAGLPVPQLIDVRRASDSAIDTKTLTERLGAIAAGAVVEDHQRWLDRLYRVGRVVQVAATATVLLIGLVGVVTVVFTTRTGLLIHTEIIELLHLIGARDAYVAGQFQWHAFHLGLRGGAAGLAAALATLGALGTAGRAAATVVADAVLPGVELSLLAWVLILLLPVLVGTIGLVTARITVLRALAQMP